MDFAGLNITEKLILEAEVEKKKKCFFNLFESFFAFNILARGTGKWSAEVMPKTCFLFC